MTDPQKILSTFTPKQQKLIQQVLEAEKEQWVESIKPKEDEFGLRRLPRDPYNQSKFLPVFKTDKHEYKIIGEGGIGIERHTAFQKRSIQRGFASDFQQIYDTWQELKLFIAGESNVGKLKSDAVIKITAIQDSVADFSKEQYEAALWLCTLFVLREDEKVSSYDLKIAEEKIRDWAAYGLSELDFFLLSGSMVKGYGSYFNETIKKSDRARQKYLDAILTDGKLEKEGASAN